MAESVIDIVTRNVVSQFEGALGQLTAEAEAVKARGDKVIADLEAEGRARMDMFFETLPSAPILGELQSVDLDGFDPVEWIKAQAKSRAWRTLLQGLLAVVVVAVGNVVVQAFTQGTLSVFSWDDWKVVATLAGSATLAAAISYLQNALGIKPPKAQ